jgi:UDP:flavonoid glycosyltransferase YjiC (YdhE family)
MPDTRKTILFFPFNLLSHYLRCLVLADTYDQANYRVLFLSSRQYDGFVKSHGYEVFSGLNFDEEFVMQCTNNFNFDWLNLADVEKVMLSQVECISQLKADFVIGDVAPTLKMAAEITGAIYIGLVNGYMTRYYASTRHIPKKHPAYGYIKKLPPTFADVLTQIGEKLAFRKIQAPFRTLRKKYGLQKVKDYLEELEGKENLICDLPELFPQKMLPPGYKFIGPLVYQFEEAELAWQKQVDWQKPVICVCMGSTGDWSALSFLNDPYFSRYTIITAGDKNRVLSAPHVFSRTFINLNQVLQKSSLMICHGGNGTIYTGIFNQVFMLCLSSHFEQDYNIEALERKGYGKSAADFTIEMWQEQIQFHCERIAIKQPA